jgi:2-dehydro-3-deoxyphosphooctonate aldolase (KDO 8-P synthase)
MIPVQIGSVPVGNTHPPVLIAGPCVIESQEQLISTASRIRDLAGKYGFPYILKSSFEKANRTSKNSFRGPGLEAGLDIFAKVRSELNVPVLTDVHLPEQAQAAAAVVDCLQIPAFLSRQTDLIEAAASTQLPLNIKKAQFMTPVAMKHALEKAAAAGSGGAMVTERGTSFGYGDLVVDMRSFVVLAEMACPVIFDATHSVQQPGTGVETGGERRFIAPLAFAAAATGFVDGIFLEAHPDPSQALSDAGSQLALEDLEPLLERLHKTFEATGRSFTSQTETIS